MRSTSSSIVETAKGYQSKVFKYKPTSIFESHPALDYYSFGTQQRSIQELVSDPRCYDIDVSNSGLQHFKMPKNKNQENLRALNLSMNRLSSIPYCQLGKALIAINLSHNSLSSLKGIEICSNLRLLNASNNKLISYASLSRNGHLEEIYLSKNLIQSI